MIQSDTSLLLSNNTKACTISRLVKEIQRLACNLGTEFAMLCTIHYLRYGREIFNDFLFLQEVTVLHSCGQQQTALQGYSVTFTGGTFQCFCFVSRRLEYKIFVLSDKYEPRYKKAAFCICENKNTNQLRGYRVAEQRLCFRYMDSTIPLLPKSEISSL